MNTDHIRDACEICSCDHFEHPIVVQCDAKNLSNLTNIFFNASIETLTFSKNSLTLEKGTERISIIVFLSISSLVDDLIKINNLTSLKSLVLSNNPLGIIPQLFLPNLIDLQLENTSLTTAVFPRSYENCTNLQYLTLSKNNLTEITSDQLKFFPLLRNISLDNVGFHSINPTTFLNHSTTLQSLSLQSNSLKSAEFLSFISHLHSINFDKNSFDQFPKELIPLIELKHLSFRDNHIHTIDESSFLFTWMKRNLSDIEIYLSNNPIDCCQSRWFLRYLIGPKNLVRDSHDLLCASPKLFAGKRLLDLHIDLMDCSDGPFYPSTVHLSKIILILLSLCCIVIFILFVVGATLYRRNRFHFRRRQGYQIIRNGDDDHRQI